jgi:hypothetical protein
VAKNPLYDQTNPAALSKSVIETNRSISNLHNLIKHSASGFDSDKEFSSFSQYVVQDVIFEPKLFFENDPERKTEVKYREKYNITETPSGVPFRALPRNSIIAKKITKLSIEDESEVLFPFFPSHLSLPCKPGEHIWVFHMDSESQGFWICRIQGFDLSDDVNHTHFPRDLNSNEVYSDKAGNLNKKITTNVGFKPAKTVINKNDEEVSSINNKIHGIDNEYFYEEILENSQGSKLSTYEPIPRYKKRPGDLVLEGSNNSLIVMGTDRVESVGEIEQNEGVNSFKKSPLDFSEESGSIDLVVGRGRTEKTKSKEIVSKKINGTDFLKENDKLNSSLKEGDVDLINDTTRVLLSQRTKTDQNSKIDEITKEFEIVDSEQGDGSVLLKSDKIRLLARKDVVILVGDASIVINSQGDIIFTPSPDGLIKLGGADANLAMLCNTSVDTRNPSSTPPIIDSMGGSQGSGGAAGQFATKVLVK